MHAAYACGSPEAGIVPPLPRSQHHRKRLQWDLSQFACEAEFSKKQGIQMVWCEIHKLLLLMTCMNPRQRANVGLGKALRTFTCACALK
jgi:hypothetical protein